MAQRPVFVLSALAVGCAPLANLRPAGELADNHRSYELGAAAVGLGPRPYVEEEWQLTGQVWGTLALSRWVELSAIGAFDNSGLAAGGALRWTPLSLHRVAAGGEVELGFAWAALALPVAVQPLDGVWLYTAPRLGNQGVYLTPAVPLGLSVQTFQGLMVRAEVDVSWADFLAYQRRTHLGFGLAYQW
ncbi:MAG TPA: hypothetical protein VGP93_16595 [Polyangiaceae bacterium]|jgi:hypothetical protein|nr:hypothetical protein [Polyangiaceae bacterium]